MAATLRPEFVVFYAWQSDRPGNRTRYFIQEAAADAAAEINADPASAYDVRIDQDTQGVPGLCDIPATILEKIDKADGFLCDLTYVALSQSESEANDDFQPRYCSNPNVLFELGYAFRSLGHERLICVMNDEYGPAAEQIFDLAHRRFPFAYRISGQAGSKSAVRAELSAHIATAIRQMFPLGRRSDAATGSRVAAIRSQFEAKVRNGSFHRLVRRAGAIAIAVIPTATKKFEFHELQSRTIAPMRGNGWNPEVRGRSVLAPVTHGEDRVTITELQDDGVILAADTWILDPTFHARTEKHVPSLDIERAIIASVARYIRTLLELKAPSPWYICVSLLEIKGYRFLASNSEASRTQYPDTDIIADPIVARSTADIDSNAKIAHLLRPAIDFIWREFGFSGSYHYNQAGVYDQRFVV